MDLDKINKAIKDSEDKMLEVNVTTVAAVPVVHVLTYGPESLRDTVYLTELKIIRDNPEVDFDFHFHANEE